MASNDFSNGDHSAKRWFQLEWNDKWIQVFILFFVVLIIQLFYVPECIDFVKEAFQDEDYGKFLQYFGGVLTLMGVFIPLGGSALIGYKAFYQKWQDYIHGRSR